MFHVDLVRELPGMVFCRDEAVGAARWFPARLLELIRSASHEHLHNIVGVQGDQGGGCSTAEELHTPAMESLEVLHNGVWAAGGPGGRRSRRHSAAGAGRASQLSQPVCRVDHYD